MLNRIRQLFSQPANQTVSDELFIEPETPREFGVSVDGIAHIRQMKNGKFRLLVNQNEVIGTYARHRDAVRGANRRGLNVVS